MLLWGATSCLYVKPILTASQWSPNREDDTALKHIKWSKTSFGTFMRDITRRCRTHHLASDGNEQKNITQFEAVTAGSTPINEADFLASSAQTCRVDDPGRGRLDILRDLAVTNSVDDMAQRGGISNENVTPENEFVSGCSYARPAHHDMRPIVQAFLQKNE